MKQSHSVAVVWLPGEDSYIAVHLNGSTRRSVDALEAQARQALCANVVSTARETHSSIQMLG